MKNTLFTLGILIALSVIILFQNNNEANALTTLIASGDFGGKSASIANLRNIDNTDRCFIGIGDYMYDKRPSTKVINDVTLGQLWDNIRCKVGFPGNHEELKHQEEVWAQQTFKYSSQGYGAWRLNDVGIIGISAYSDFEKGSDQYNFVIEKAQKMDLNPEINKIIFVTHEPLWTPTTEGGHGPNVDLRDTYTDIIKIHDGFLIQAHNHIIGFGNNDEINQAVCGGGGYGGDTLGKLNGYFWATAKPGYCEFTFNGDGGVRAKAIGTDGKIMRSQFFSK